MYLTEVVQTKQALGGDVSIALVSEANPQALETIFRALWKSIFQFERQFSRFLPMSELSIFNRGAGLRRHISPEFGRLLTASKRFSTLTDGLYNPFILPALQRVGYVQSAAPGYEEDPVDDFSRRFVVAASELEVDDDSALIPFNSALDLGGCGKGYLADELREQLQPLGLAGYSMSFGGDIATAGINDKEEPWTVYIQSATDLGSVHNLRVTCPTTPFAVATSGTFRRTAQQSSKSWHHIINPTTGEPATTDVQLATICAPTTLEADVYASCAVILGSRRAPAFLSAHDVPGILLQCKNGTQTFESSYDHSPRQSLLAPAERMARHA